MTYPCFDLSASYYVYYIYDCCCSCMPAPQFCDCLVDIKHYGFGKRFCPSAKIS